MKIKIILVDDHPMVVAGLKALLDGVAEFEVCSTASCAVHAMAEIKKYSPEVILLDINLPDISGIDLCKKVKKEFPEIKVLAMSTFSDKSYVSRMIKNGASGYIIKSATSEEIKEAIRKIIEGNIYLSLPMEQMLQTPNPMPAGALPLITKREKEVLQLIAEGLTNGQIAEKLVISQLTVDTHRKNLLTKLRAGNTAALIRIAIEHQLIN